MNKSKNKLFASALSLCLISSTAGVYAGTIIDSYKTPRGNTATIESENPNIGSGKFEMNYQYDKETGHIKLNVEKWIENPFGYVMVDIIGGVNHGYINGNISAGNGFLSVKHVK